MTSEPASRSGGPGTHGFGASRAGDRGNPGERGWGGQPGWGGGLVDDQPAVAADQPADAPTPPTGLPLGTASSGPPEDDPDDATPPAGIGGLSEVVSSEDFGSAGPAVFGGADPVGQQGRGDAGQWPTLTYRSKGKSKRSRGALDWLRGGESG